MLQQLALAQGFGLDGADPKSADFVHTVVECAKLAFADRDTFYGDPDFQCSRRCLRAYTAAY
jgi:gamma-glutamyltranspeptidase/glutathione hydrolase